MAEHFSKSTVEAKFWCKKHGRPTMHNVNDGRRGSCQECIADLEAEKVDRDAAAAAAPKQESLFG